MIEAPPRAVQRSSLLVEEVFRRVSSRGRIFQQRAPLPRRFRLFEDDLSAVLQDLLVHGVGQVLKIDLTHHLDTVRIQVEDLEVGIVVSDRGQWWPVIGRVSVSVSTDDRLVHACLASAVVVHVVEMMVRMMMVVMMIVVIRRAMTAMALALLTGLR